MPSPDIRAVKSKVDAGRGTLHKIPGVTSTGITHSSVTGIDTAKPDYQVLVIVKDASVLKFLPSNINGIRVVYKIIPGVPKALTLLAHNYQSLDSNRYRPLRAGSEITNLSTIPSGGGCWVGTLGGFPYLPDGTTKVILSNNHVLAHDTPGERTAAVGQTIYQPGCQTEGIGNLASWIPINSSGNLVDAAYATITSGIQTNDYGLCNYKIGSAVTPAVGMGITKSGRTTGCVTGTIVSLDQQVTVDYSDTSTPAQAEFTGQVLTSSGFIAGGDSGSVAVTNDGKYSAVGLMYAGYDDGSGVMSPMSYVKQLLGVEFLGTGDAIPPAAGQCDPVACPSNTNYCISGTCFPKSYTLIGLGTIGLVALLISASR